MNEKIRVRFAPSPTGYLHIGSLRTVLYNYFFARRNNGTLILRIEDTDRTRFVPGALEALIKTLSRIGLEFDEGPYIKADNEIAQKGDFGPYIQSERLDTYKQYAKQLLDAGKAYPCFCSEERLALMRRQQELAKMQPKYDRECLKLNKEETKTRIEAGESHVLRFLVPEGQTVFDDIIHGKITVQNKDIDDQVLVKSDGFPTYHLASVVDDHLMEITHVIRGDEWLPSTPKHKLLYDAFGWQAPQFAHLPLLLNPDKSKLSKRQGDVSVEDFLNKGYLQETLINFVSLLGWNPKGDQEIYTKQELTDLFELEKINKTGAIMNIEKLNWLNNHYLRTKSQEEIFNLIENELKTAEKATVLRLIEISKERSSTSEDFILFINKTISIPDYNPELLIWQKSDRDTAQAILQEIHEFLTSVNETDFEINALESKIKEYIKQKSYQNGDVLWPLRVALSGLEQSPSPFELAWAIGKTETLHRIQNAIQKLWQ
ncbi:MAG: hypothetical protein ACD_76C00105G0014 [uncultured bacterium]|nr:MAG: hypothetical protein ACD_76C00105G0014 [uncultured bacterium]HBD05604.1 glutamate--tRNA ligase [Candidatus Uhrbacteria bacterium]